MSSEPLTDPLAELFLQILQIDGRPLKLTPFQDKLFSDQGRYQAYRVHRRAGATLALAVKATYQAMLGKQVLVVAPTGHGLGEIFRRISRLLTEAEYGEFITRQVSSPHRIELSSRGSIQGVSGSRNALCGHLDDVILIDQASYLEPQVWATLVPIMAGDHHRKEKPQTYAVGIGGRRPNYFNSLFSYPSKQVWETYTLPVTENPLFSPEYVAEARALCPDEATWRTEWLVEYLGPTDALTTDPQPPSN